MESFRVHVESPGWERRTARSVYGSQVTASASAQAGFGPGGLAPPVASHRWWLLVESDRGRLAQIAADVCTPCHGHLCRVEGCAAAALPRDEG